MNEIRYEIIITFLEISYQINFYNGTQELIDSFPFFIYRTIFSSISQKHLKMAGIIYKSSFEIYLPADLM